MDAFLRINGEKYQQHKGHRVFWTKAFTLFGMLRDTICRVQYFHVIILLKLFIFFLHFRSEIPSVEDQDTSEETLNNFYGEVFDLFLRNSL